MQIASVIADDLWSQLFNGIFSWAFLQFIIAFLSFFGFVLTSAIILILAERKFMGWMQDRYGPLHTGPWGLLQTVADVGKLLMKEDIHAVNTDKSLFLLAPSVFLAPVIGGLRSAAQMISYELPLVLALVGIVMLTSVLSGSGLGTISIKQIIDIQNSSPWPGQGIPFWDFIFKGFTPWAWFFLVQPLMLVIYYTCGLAETNRSPFDLPEAESELVAGYLTEYSGMRWALFYLGEYGNMTIVAAITTYLFLGGWSGPGVVYLLGLGSPGWGLLGNLLAVAYFVTKVFLLCFIFIWVRSTLPRLRADQLMQFAWLILIPITLFNILLTGLIFLVVNSLGLGSYTSFVFLVVTAICNWAMLFAFIWIVGRTTTSTTRRAQAPAIRAQQRAGTAVQVPERAGATGGQ